MTCAAAPIPAASRCGKSWEQATEHRLRCPGCQPAVSTRCTFDERSTPRQRRRPGIGRCSAITSSDPTASSAKRCRNRDEHRAKRSEADHPISSRARFRFGQIIIGVRNALRRGAAPPLNKRRPGVTTPADSRSTWQRVVAKPAKAKASSASCFCSYPVFTHPAPLARAHATTPRRWK
jgi:hypothetical protein